MAGSFPSGPHVPKAGRTSTWPAELHSSASRASFRKGTQPCGRGVKHTQELPALGPASPAVEAQVASGQHPSAPHARGSRLTSCCLLVGWRSRRHEPYAVHLWRTRADTWCGPAVTELPSQRSFLGPSREAFLRSKEATRASQDLTRMTRRRVGTVACSTNGQGAPPSATARRPCLGAVAGEPCIWDREQVRPGPHGDDTHQVPARPTS